MKGSIVKPTKKEVGFMVGLLKSVEAEFKSSRAIGMKIPKEEEEIVSSLSKKFEHLIARKAKYCSRECYNARNPRILDFCLFCGKEFWEWKCKNKKYCSRMRAIV